MQIDYKLLGAAQEFYRDKGFHYIEVPWVVDGAALELTSPYEDWELLGDEDTGYTVASGEQSFLQCAMDGSIVKDLNYFTITPCYRAKDNTDLTHTTEFMKCELFSLIENKDPHAVLEQFKSEAFQFFSQLTNPPLEFQLDRYSRRDVDLVGPIDLMQDGLELGSYGIRKAGPLLWVYGTGLAEPRFSNYRNK